jgi:hypothetical protein
MACGHRAHGVTPDGSPVCPICIGDPRASRVAELPALDGRTAKCDCGRTAPSSLALAFFEFRGAGSRHATERCECGYYESAHGAPAGTYSSRTLSKPCPEFKPRGPAETDRYYCGCRGWD